MPATTDANANHIIVLIIFFLLALGLNLGLLGLAQRHFAVIRPAKVVD